MTPATEWLFNQLWDTPKDKLTWYALLEQAKEIEKQQMIDAYHINPQESKWENIGINYYTETYGSKGNETKPHSFCETPEEKCTLNYCDENGCLNRKRELLAEDDELQFIKKQLENIEHYKLGYNVAQRKLYTKEQVMDAIKLARQIDYNGSNNYCNTDDEIIQSLKK